MQFHSIRSSNLLFCRRVWEKPEYEEIKLSGLYHLHYSFIAVTSQNSALVIN